MRRLWGPTLFLATIMAVGVLFNACRSSTSSPNTTADSTKTPPTSTVSEAPPPPSPAPPSTVEAKGRSVAQKLTDTSLETRVKRALVHTSSLRVFSFRPNVVNGHLVLHGDVNTPDQYRQAERIARQVEGIEAVTNRLTMGGRPVTEERLSSDEKAPKGDAAVYHTVRQGDTLWDIARKYRASIQQIKNLNDLRSSGLQPGQRIRVR